MYLLRGHTASQDQNLCQWYKTLSWEPGDRNTGVVVIKAKVIRKGTPISHHGHCPSAVSSRAVLEYAPNFLTGQSWGSLAEAPFHILPHTPRRENGV